jgi:hypothetical protein
VDGGRACVGGERTLLLDAGGPLRRRALSFGRWWFRNRRTGQITVAQFPNLALWIVLVTVAGRTFVPTGTHARDALDWTGVVALTWWAVDELIRGVNPWRRLLGVCGCAFAVAALVTRLS